jgi:putative transposase
VAQTGTKSTEATAPKAPLRQRHPRSWCDGPNGVWTYDFVHDRPANGSRYKRLCVLDENTRECLAIEVGKSLRSNDIILTLSRLMRVYGKPAFIRSDYGAEFTATAVMKRLRDQNVGPAYIKPGSP